MRLVRTTSPRDLVPILSWLFEQGKCRTCGARIGARHIVFEACLALLFALSYLSLGISLELVFFLLSLAVLAFIVAYDLKHTVVPAVASLFLFSFSAAFALLSAGSIQEFGGALLTAGAIGFAFFLLYALSSGRAMGLGDAPVALSLSLLVAPYAFSGLLFSFWIGAVIGIAVLVLRRGGPKMGIEVPFVPFLAVGYLLAYFTTWSPFLAVSAL